jgi:hypothetical protein
MKKNSQLLIRVSDLEKKGFERAAEISGIGLSSWARQILRSAAIKKLQESGEKIIFLEPLPLNKN